MIRACAALIAAIWAGQAAAWCALPVENGQAKGIEVEQPWRLADRTVEIPGVQYLFINPTNRGGLYRIRDGRFEKYTADFPNDGLGGLRHWVREDGLVWGVDDKSLYQFQRGQDGFKKVDLPKFINYRYDPLQQVMLLMFEDADLMQWDGQELRLSRFGPIRYGRDHVLPTYQPDVGLYVARPGRGIYVSHPDAPDVWEELNFGFLRSAPKKWAALGPTAMTASGDGRIVGLHAAGDTYVFERKGKTELHWIYTIDGVPRLVKGADQTLWAKSSHPRKDALRLDLGAPAYMKQADLPVGHPARDVPLGERKFNYRASNVFGGAFFRRDREPLTFQAHDGTEEVVTPFLQDKHHARYIRDVPGEEYGLALSIGGLYFLHRNCPGE